MQRGGGAAFERQTIEGPFGRIEMTITRRKRRETVMMKNSEKMKEIAERFEYSDFDKHLLRND